MKTEMSEGGVITIRPESAMEAYALKFWSDNYRVIQSPEQHVGRARSMLTVDANWPQEQPK